MMVWPRLMLSRALPYFLLVTALVAQSAQTLQVIPLPRDGEVLVSFKLEEALTDEIRSAMQSGLTAKFVYKVELRRSSAAWLDRTIASATILAQVKYDTLTRQYQYSRAVDGRTQVADTTGSEEVAWSNLTQDFTRLSLFRGVSLEPNAEYYVRVTVNSSPRNSVFVWPWRAADAVGLGKFTFVR